MKKTAAKKIETAVIDMLREIISAYCEECNKKYTTCSGKCELWKFSDFLSGAVTKDVKGKGGLTCETKNQSSR